MKTRRRAVDGAWAGSHDAQERLLEAVSEVVGRDGFAELTVERLLATAGVSRATFYQHFVNVDECFWHAYRRHARWFVSQVNNAPRGDGPRALAVLDAVVATASANQRVARLLMCEGLAAGTRGLAARDALIAEIERAIGGGAAQARIDLPLAILIGGAFRFLAMRIVKGDPLDGVRGEVGEWARAFVRRSSQPSWSARFAPVPAESAPRSAVKAKRGRPSGAPRERILRATAAAVREHGYRAVTVTDIARAAGVARRSFYNEFPGKAEAFGAAYEETVQRTLAVCAPAFFTPGAWPQRVWLGIDAATRLLAREPLFAYLGFVEAHAVGPPFTARAHDAQLAFTLFLEEGYRQRPQAASLSRACSALCTTAIFETGFQACRYDASLYIRRMQPLAVYIALAPFTGLDAAGEFVTGKLSASASPPEQ